MIHTVRKIGDSTSVISRITSNSAAIRPVKLLDIEAQNMTGNVLYLMYFNAVSAVPNQGTVPDESFPVQAGLGGTLGKERDIDGGIAVWSTTQGVLTAAVANSGSIIFLLKD
jgi:hypothetical protein